LLRAGKGPSKAAIAETSLAQAPKGKESMKFLLSITTRIGLNAIDVAHGPNWSCQILHDSGGRICGVIASTVLFIPNDRSKERLIVKEDVSCLDMPAGHTESVRAKEVADVSLRRVVARALSRDLLPLFAV
jgi:hypothetical protein